MKTSKLHRDVIIGLTGLTLALSGPVSAKTDAELLQLSNDVASLQSLPASALKDELLQLDEVVRAKAIRKLNKLGIRAHDLRSLRVDPTGMLFYAHKAPERVTTAPPLAKKTLRDAASRASATLSEAETFNLSSKPDSPNTFYLDFNGYNMPRSSPWRFGSSSVAEVTANSYDADGNLSAFSTQELSDIAEIWRQVAEDFAPFNVNVTTKEPRSLPVTAHAPDPKFIHYGDHVAHVVFTNSSDTNGALLPGGRFNLSAGYMGLWGTTDLRHYTPTFVYTNKFVESVSDIAEETSHQLGHVLGLKDHEVRLDFGTHTAITSAGNSNWAPIMSFTENSLGKGVKVTQWSDGNFPDSDTSDQDDVRIIRSQLGAAKSDHEKKRFTDATPLLVDADGTIRSTDLNSSPVVLNAENKGIISRRHDRDLFKFYAKPGRFMLTAKGHRTLSEPSRGGNLNIRLSLFDQKGRLLDVTDRSDRDATLDRLLDWGLYYIAVEGIASRDAGNYGSMGHYFLSGKMENGPANPANFPIPVSKAFDDYFKVRNPGGKGTFRPLANDHGVKLKMTGVSAARHGTVSFQPGGLINYVPASGFTGQDEFTYTMQDKTGRTSSATVHITVIGPSGS